MCFLLAQWVNSLDCPSLERHQNGAETATDVPYNSMCGNHTHKRTHAHTQTLTHSLSHTLSLTHTHVGAVALNPNTPLTLNPKPHTLNPKPHTLNPKPHNLGTKPCTHKP
jgi:hypothetical protein